MRTTPTLRYFISDAYGADSPDPTQAVVDADVHLETDLSVIEDALANGDEHELDQLGGGFPTKINSRGREISLPRHLAGLIHSWHDKHEDVLKDRGIFNGLFINYAPRTKAFRNGPPFYEVEMNSGLRIVTTYPGDMLAGIRGDVHSIAEIDNEGHPLFGPKAQFRSRDAHRHLRKENPYPKKFLQDNDADDILRTQHFGNGVEGLRIKFADTYGNIVAEPDELVKKKILHAVNQGLKDVRIRINGVELPGQAALSMTDAPDGTIAIYSNGENIDLIRKWKDGEDSTFTTENSAYVLFGRPKEVETGIVVEFDPALAS